MQTRAIRLPLPVDPELPEGFDCTPNDERSSAELDEWWDQPFLVTHGDGRFCARCLNGGAWDRSTGLGFAASIEEATVVALAAQAAWVKHRGAPVAEFGAGGYTVVVPPQRPDQDPRELAHGLNAEQAQALIQSETGKA